MGQFGRESIAGVWTKANYVFLTKRSGDVSWRTRFALLVSGGPNPCFSESHSISAYSRGRSGHAGAGRRRRRPPIPRSRRVATPQGEIPVFRVTVVGRTVPAINYRPPFGRHPHQLRRHRADAEGGRAGRRSRARRASSRSTHVLTSSGRHSASAVSTHLRAVGDYARKDAPPTSASCRSTVTTAVSR